jgi:large subunit ribosomal protein L24
MKVKQGDKIKVTTGKYKGTEGTITKVLKKKDRVLVEGVNVKKRAVKKSDSNNESFVYIQHSIHVSNVRLSEDKQSDKKTSKKTKSEKKS